MLNEQVVSCRPLRGAGWWLAVGALAVGVGLSAPASAQVQAIRLISEGDPYDPFGTGDPNDEETVEAIGRPGINASGGYVARVRTIVPFNNTGLAFIFGDPTGADGFVGSILHEEINDTINDNGTARGVAGYSARIDISDAGVLSYGADMFVSGGQTDVIVVGNDVVLQSGAAISDGPGSIGSPNFIGSTFDDSALYVSSSFGSDNVGLFRRDGGTGALTTILQTGDALGGGNTVLNQTQGGSFGNTDFSRSNDRYITSTDINPAIFSPSNPFPITDALVVDGAIPTAFGSSSLIIDDVTIPTSAGGLAGEVWEGFNEKAINSAGNWITGATTNADDLTGGGEWVIVKDGQIVFRGDGTILGVAINDFGDYAFSYQDQIYLNGEVVIDTSTPVDTGETIARMQFGLALSERNASNEVTVAFKARDSTDPLTGSFGPDLYAAVIALGEALLGDYNGSGQVEQGDLDLVLQNWGVDSTGNVPAGWVNDLPEGIIEQTELDGVLQNWGATSAPDFRGVAVPEPATAGILAFFAGWGLTHRRNRG